MAELMGEATEDAGFEADDEFGVGVDDGFACIQLLR